MNDAPDRPGTPDARQGTPTADVHRRRLWSWVWAIPVVSLLIGGWLAYDALANRGPLITVRFQSSEGLQAGQSKLRYKQVDVGTIERIALDRELSRVEMTIRMDRDGAKLLRDGAQFWVVKPRLFAGNLSGLDTLLSGAYVAMAPGSGEPATARTFDGLENPPVLESQEPGRTFLVRAPRIGSISLGSPVFYRDFDVGEVLGWDVADMADSVTLHVLVRAPFDKYVHDGSRFWNASGAQLKLGGQGVQLQLQSVRALLLGGIAFETGSEARKQPPSQDNHEFPLFADQDAANVASYLKRVKFVAYFDNSVQGLSAGSDVTSQGLRIGEVTSVNLVYYPDQNRVRAVVRFEVEPDRITVSGETAPDPTDTARDLLERGMKAQLISGNLLTGSMTLGITPGDDKHPAQVASEGDTLVIPTRAGAGLSQVASSASDLLNHLRDLPLDQIAANLNETLKGASAVTNGPELRDTLASAQATMKELQDTVHHLDQGVSPVLRQLPEIAAGLRETVAKANKLVGSVDAGYGEDSKFSRDLGRVLAQLGDTARSVRALADLLDRHPEALIRGRAGTGSE